MPLQPLRVLLIEDNPDDAALLMRELITGGYIPLIERVETEADLIAALDTQDWDACIADYSLPTFGAPAALAIIRGRGMDIPCIVLTGTVGEEKIVELMRAGANDVVFKSATARLLPALARELADAAMRTARRAADTALQMSYMALRASHATLLASIDALIEGFVYLLDLRDQETEEHTRRVARMTERLGRLMGVTNGALLDYRRGALLHDIGKMGVPDAILLKNGVFTDEERAEMQKHPIYAIEALRSVPLLEEASKIPYCHHEKWDGTGYPRGLRGEDIPHAARVFSVVDVYDALTSARPYKKAWTHTRAMREIKASAGSSFDPRVVAAFCRGMKSGVLR